MAAKKWEIENDARTLREAEEIKNDKKRLRAAIKELQEQKRATLDALVAAHGSDMVD